MEEIKSLHKNKTQGVVELFKEKMAIGCKWVFRKKEAVLEKEEEKFKAWLLANGYPQREVVDYNEVLFPVVRHAFIRTLILVLVANINMELKQLDVETTFRYGDSEEKSCIKQPKGFK